jgi:hypothetical protein
VRALARTDFGRLVSPVHVRRGLRVAIESLGWSAARGVMLLGEVPVVAHRGIEVGTFVLMRARAASRAAPTSALPNETLQLTGAGLEEVVVASALDRTVSQLHLPCPQTARS